MRRERPATARSLSRAAYTLKKRRCTERPTVGSLRPAQSSCRQVFPFLDLPGELRNNVYQWAHWGTYFRFPAYSFRVRLASEPALGDLSVVATTADRYKAIPYLGLAHSCSQIRREFYYPWLETHFIALSNAKSWFQTFFPVGIRKACIPFASGTFSIYVARRDFQNSDVLPVLKHLARFPRCRVNFDRDRRTVNRSQWRGLVAFLRNSHPRWKRWVDNHVISQIRLKENKITIVVKDKYATPWMKKTFPIPIPPVGFLASLGLTEQFHWEIRWAVDYS